MVLGVRCCLPDFTHLRNSEVEHFSLTTLAGARVCDHDVRVSDREDHPHRVRRFRTLDGFENLNFPLL